MNIDEIDIEYQKVLMGINLDYMSNDSMVVNIARAIHELGEANNLTQIQLLKLMVIEYHKALSKSQTRLNDYIKEKGAHEFVKGQEAKS